MKIKKMVDLEDDKKKVLDRGDRYYAKLIAEMRKDGLPSSTIEINSQKLREGMRDE